MFTYAKVLQIIYLLYYCQKNSLGVLHYSYQPFCLLCLCMESSHRLLKSRRLTSCEYSWPSLTFYFGSNNQELLVVLLYSRTDGLNLRIIHFMDGNKLQIQFAIKELSTSSSLIIGTVARALMIFIIHILGINFWYKV